MVQGKQRQYIIQMIQALFRGDSSSISIRRINEGDEILVVGEEKDGLFYANTIMNLTIDE